MSKKMEILVNEELLKNKLTPCREICPILLDVFTWRKDFYPCILASFITFFFGMLWYMNPPVITAFAVFGLIVTICDFVIPLVSKSVSSQENWTSEKEKKFSIFVNRIAYYSIQTWNFQVTMEEWKKDKPNVYSASIIVSLLILAWLGNLVNNLFLVYLFVLILALLPGLLHRRILQMYLSFIFVWIANILGVKRKQN